MFKFAMFLKTKGKSVIFAQTQYFYCEDSQSVAVVRNLNALFSDFTRNLHKHTLMVSILYPVTGVQMEKLKEFWDPKGTGGRILRNLMTTAEDLNFTFVLQLPTGGSKTGFKVNGTWNEITGDVIYGRADIGVPFGISLERLAVVEICAAFEYVRVNRIE